MGPFTKQVSFRVPQAYRRAGCKGIVFAISADIGRGTPGTILDLLGFPIRNRGEAGERLTRLIESHASKMQEIPPVAAVTREVEPCDARVENLLTVISVITKSSDTVFIKSKRPLLSQLRKVREVTLLFPDFEGGIGC